MQDICIEVSQRSSVSLILFNIYLSDIFNKIEQENPDIIVLSFIDNVDFLVVDKIVKDIKDILIKVEELVVE